MGHLNIATPAYKSGLTIHRIYLTGTSCKATYGSTYTILLFPTQGISLKAPYSLSQSIIFWCGLTHLNIYTMHFICTYVILERLFSLHESNEGHFAVVTPPPAHANRPPSRLFACFLLSTLLKIWQKAEIGATKTLFSQWYLNQM